MTDLLTPEIAAKRLGISTKQLRAFTRRGEIRYVNVGLGEERQIRRYDETDLDAFIESRKRTQWPSRSTRRGKRTGTTSSVVGVDFLETRLKQLNGRQKK